MSNLVKTKERVSQHGEVFTPEHIVKDMIALFPDSDWSSLSCVVLEPTCGNGNFIVEIVKKKINRGLSLYDSLNTTFGMDIMEDNISECHERLFKLCFEYLKKQELSKAKFKNNIIKCYAVILNNIFVVKDSITYIQNGDWDRKKFLEIDPTLKKKKKNNFIVEENEDDEQTLNEHNKNKIYEQATAIFKRKFENAGNR